MEKISIEELEEMAVKEQDPLRRIDIANELAWKLKFSNPERGFGIAKDTIDQSGKLGYPRGRAYALLSQGACCMQLGKFEEGYEISSEAKLFLEEQQDKYGTSRAYNNIGAYYYLTSNYHASLEWHFKSLLLSEEINHLPGKAISLMNLGNVYKDLKDFEKSIFYQDQSLQLFQELGHKQGVVAALANLGNAYSGNGDYEKALEMHHEALKVGKQLDFLTVCINAHNNIGGIFLEQKNYSKAKIHFEECIRLNAGNQEHLLAVPIGCLGIIAFLESKPGEALDLLNKALAISEKLHHHAFVCLWLEEMFKVYKSLGDYNKALEYYEKTVALQKQIYSDDQARKIKNLENENLRKESELQRIKNNELRKAYDAEMKLNEQLSEKNRIIETQKEKILSSINYARRIQQGILIEEGEVRKWIPDSFIYYQPKDIVSGDFYWVSFIRGKYIIAAVDCTGHGVPGAFMSMIGYMLLNQVTSGQQTLVPAEVLVHLNRGVFSALKQEKGLAHSDDGMDISLCVIDSEKKEIQFAGAQHSLYMIGKTGWQSIKGDIHSIGGRMTRKESLEERAFTNHLLPLEKGACIYLCTDGYADQFGGEGKKKYGGEQFRQQLLKHHHLPMEEQKKLHAESHETWKGKNAQTDDVLLMGFRL